MGKTFSRSSQSYVQSQTTNVQPSFLRPKSDMPRDDVIPPNCVTGNIIVEDNTVDPIYQFLERLAHANTNPVAMAFWAAQ